MIFSGTMSLENNGGFSSVRSEWREMDLSEFDGILIRVKGDGKTYRFRLRSAETGNEVSYNSYFKTLPDTWITIFVPFRDMVPTFRGFVLDQDPINQERLSSFGFMLSDKQPGEFALEVDWIRAVNLDELNDYRSK